MSLELNPEDSCDAEDTFPVYETKCGREISKACASGLFLDRYLIRQQVDGNIDIVCINRSNDVVTSRTFVLPGVTGGNDSYQAR